MSSAPSPPPSLGLTVPGVQLLEVIGRGGFATVYGGVQDSLERPVAVKVDSRVLHDERNRRRYLREVQAASRITGHPHVVSLIDTGVLPDFRPYIVMERCDGGSLTDLAGRERLSAADAVALVAATSSALGAAHKVGVLHRDVKPDNILLDSFGSPRLTDFGIASVEREGQDPTVTLECLTPDFACPEAFRLATPRASGDVWSMGAVLYYLLVGQGPRRAPDGSSRSFADMVKVLDDPVSLNHPAIPPAVREVLAVALAPDPLSRYQDGLSLADALNALGQVLGSGAMTVTGPGVALRLARAASLPTPSGGRTGAPEGAPAGPGAPAAGMRQSLGAPSSPRTAAGSRPPVPVVAAPPAGARQSRRGGLALGAAGLVLGTVLGLGLGWFVWAQAATGSVASVRPTASPAPGDQATLQAQGSGGATGASGGAPLLPVGTCLRGVTSVSGRSTAATTSCTSAHYWEVYAIGTLADSTAGTSDEELAADPNVRATCTRQAAAAYGEPDPEVSVLAPGVDGQGADRGFACIVSPAGGQQRTGSYRQ